MTKIRKAFIFSGGRGKRLGIYKKSNVKAFAKISSKKLLLNHIENINKNLEIEKIFVIITEKKSFFEEELKNYKNIEILENTKNYTYQGILSGLEMIGNYVNKDEKFIIFLADEFFEEEDFKKFCISASQISNDENLIAIKKFDFPHEYFKNYSVLLDEKKKIILIVMKKMIKLSLIIMVLV